jgi:hypothetical protein
VRPDGLTHGNAARRSNRAKPSKFRRQVLKLVGKKYSGSVETRFGPTLAAQHLRDEDGLEIDAETLRRWMLRGGALEPGAQAKAASEAAGA